MTVRIAQAGTAPIILSPGDEFSIDVVSDLTDYRERLLRFHDRAKVSIWVNMSLEHEWCELRREVADDEGYNYYDVGSVDKIVDGIPYEITLPAYGTAFRLKVKFPSSMAGTATYHYVVETE